MTRTHGLFLLWVILSVAWIIFWADRRNVVCELGLPTLTECPWWTYRSGDWLLYLRSAAILFGVPVLVGAAGWGLWRYKTARRTT